jgi:hypothetical protein
MLHSTACRRGNQKHRSTRVNHAHNIKKLLQAARGTASTKDFLYLILPVQVCYFV